MFGPQILVASMVARDGGFKHGNSWQYHSRSDYHSKVACWGLLFDLMRHCSLLRQQAASGVVAYGLNHEMRDFKTGRKKKLDLVICRPRSKSFGGEPGSFFADQAHDLGVILPDEVKQELLDLPRLQELPVGSVHIAVEAKACMTAFGKARPRLYDELSSSHVAIHGNSPHAIAVALTMVNFADTFISPGRNDFAFSDRPPTVTKHRQPSDAASVIAKIREIPRRSRDSEDGFDSLAIVGVSCKNDGSPVTLVTDPPAPQPGDIDHYEMTVHRLAQLYEQRFKNIEG